MLASSSPRFLLIVLLILPAAVSALVRVLFYTPTLSYSHVQFNVKLAELLAQDGIQVTMVVARIDDTVEWRNLADANSTGLRVIPVSTGLERGVLSRSLWREPSPFEESHPLQFRMLRKFSRVGLLFVQACKHVLQDGGALLEKLKEEKFHVGLVEQYDSCGHALFELLNIPSRVWMSATNVFRPQPSAMGLHYPISYVPELLLELDDRMSMLGRVHNLVVAKCTESMWWLMVEFELRSILSIQKPVSSVLSQSHALIANTLSVLDFPVPTLNRVLPVAGITLEPSSTTASLPTFWNETLTAWSGGFVIVSFGAIASFAEMDAPIQTAFFDAFDQHPHVLFIVKHDGIPQGGKPVWRSRNVILTQWLPQQSLLRSAQFSGLISHGGWSSALETLSAGRPILLMPLFADHARTAELVRSRRIGVIVSKTDVYRPGLLSAALHRLLHDRDIRRRALSASAQFRSMRTNLRASVLHQVRRAAKPTWREGTRKWQIATPSSPIHYYHLDAFACLLGLVFLLSTR